MTDGPIASETLSRKEINLRVFQREPIPHLLFQPRFEPWFALSARKGTLPPEVAGLTLFEFADELGSSLRYIDYFTGLTGPMRIKEHFTKRRVDVTPMTFTEIVETPRGDWVCKYQMNEDDMWYTVDYPIKSLADFDILDWILDHLTYWFDGERYAKSCEVFGDRGVPQFWVPKSPYQALCQQWMTLDTLIYALADDPARVERTMAKIDAGYDDLYVQICRSGQASIVNFGENIHAQLLSPEYWERYFEPFYQKRCAQLKSAGIYTHCHIDGFFKPILPLMSRLPFDGIEALTPLPQGDVTLDEMQDSLGDKILLDVVPAIIFLDMYSMDYFQEYVGKVVEMFGPRLILGISDEYPEGADASSMPKLRWMAEFARRTTFAR
ncbi:MAG: hypothetical protein P4L46_18190 [Fimbriimonas sp.]|nr:hypothetical protein [Fimbriimonas sp.]